MTGTVELERLMVRLVGDASQYQRMLNQAGVGTAAFARQVERLSSIVLTRLTLELSSLGTQAISTFSSFNKAMTEATSIMEGMDNGKIEEMTKAALDLSTKGKFGPTDLGKAYYELASAGMSAEQAIAALPAVQNFAIAGAFSLAEATQLASTSLNALGLATEDPNLNLQRLTHTMDVLTKANAIAVGTTRQFALAMTHGAGASMHMFNKDIEEGVALLTVMASKGVQAELAGHAFQRIMLLMSNAEGNNQEAFKAYGFSVFDEKGQAKHFADIIENMEQITKTYSSKAKAKFLKDIGFEARVQGAILPLIGSSKQIRQNEQKLRGPDTEGFSAQVAEKQMQAFANQVQMTYNNIQVLVIEMVRGFIPALNEVMTIVRGVIGAFRGMDANTKSLVYQIVGVTAAIGTFLVGLRFAAIFGSLLLPLVYSFASMISMIGSLTMVPFIFSLASQAVQALLIGLSYTITFIGWIVATLVQGVLTATIAVVAWALRWAATIFACGVYATIMMVRMIAINAMIRMWAGLMVGVQAVMFGLSVAWAAIAGFVPLLISMLPVLAGGLITLITGGLALIPLILAFIVKVVTAAILFILPFTVGLALIVAGFVVVAAVTSHWVKQLGGLAGTWAYLKQKAIEAWEWLYPVRQAVASLLDTVYEMTVKAWKVIQEFVMGVWASITGNTKTNWDEIRDTIQSAVLFIEYALKNADKTWQIIQLSFRYGWVFVGNEIEHLFKVRIPALFQWFGENAVELGSIFTDLFVRVMTAVSSIMLDILKAIPWTSALMTLVIAAQYVFGLVALLFAGIVTGRTDLSKAAKEALDKKVEIDEAKFDEKLKEIMSDGTKITEAFKQMQKRIKDLPALDITPRVEGNLEKELREKLEGKTGEFMKGYNQHKDNKLQQFLDERIQEEEDKAYDAQAQAALGHHKKIVDTAEKVGEDAGINFSKGMEKGLHHLDSVLAGSAEDLRRYGDYLDRVINPANKTFEDRQKQLAKQTEPVTKVTPQGNLTNEWDDARELVDKLTLSFPDQVRNEQELDKFLNPAKYDRMIKETSQTEGLQRILKGGEFQRQKNQMDLRPLIPNLEITPPVIVPDRQPLPLDLRPLIPPDQLQQQQVGLDQNEIKDKLIEMVDLLKVIARKEQFNLTEVTL